MHTHTHSQRVKHQCGCGLTECKSDYWLGDWLTEWVTGWPTSVVIGSSNKLAIVSSHCIWDSTEIEMFLILWFLFISIFFLCALQWVCSLITKIYCAWSIQVQVNISFGFCVFFKKSLRSIEMSYQKVILVLS